MWIAVAVAVLVLLGGVITAGAVAGMSGRAPTPSPSTPVASPTTSSAPYTVFPTQQAAPSSQGWTVQAMFGSGNGTCRSITPISGEIEAISCDTTAKILTDFTRYSGTFQQYLDTKRAGFESFTFISEDSCRADYQGLVTGTDGVRYQNYVRIYKNSPFAWTESSVVGQTTWTETVNAPVPTVANLSVLCGT